MRKNTHASQVSIHINMNVINKKNKANENHHMMIEYK